MPRGRQKPSAGTWLGATPSAEEPTSLWAQGDARRSDAGLKEVHRAYVCLAMIRRLSGLWFCRLPQATHAKKASADRLQGPTQRVQKQLTDEQGRGESERGWTAAMTGRTGPSKGSIGSHRPKRP